MKKYKNVQSSAQYVKPLEVNVDTTYVRSNIQRIETQRFIGWQYDEIQYTNKEYIELLAQQEEVTKLRKEKEQLELEMARSSAEMFETMIMLTGGM